MTDINEADCPVPFEIVANLLHADDGAIGEAAARLPRRLRAELAVFCAGRGHMRHLGLSLAAQCEPRDLAFVAGVAGSVLFSQAAARLSESVGKSGKTAVTLAGFESRKPARRSPWSTAA